ncbi:Hypothetical protein PHPALM_14844, partial [Phytophthora palmivora]
KWKSCKKGSKVTDEDNKLVSCSNSSKCSNYIHPGCFSDLVLTFGPSCGIGVAVCGKRCFNAMLKTLRVADDSLSLTKKRVQWHNDGPTPSISSVSCLIDWMTTGTKYQRYRGGDAQTGETKSTIAGTILRFIESCGVTTSRTPKDIQTTILSLEQSYKVASGWLGATGQGVEAEKSLRNAILSRCPYYYELYDIMHDRVSTKPLVLSTDNLDVSENSSDDGESETDSIATECASLSDTIPTKPISNNCKSVSSTPRSIGQTNKKFKNAVDALTTSYPLVELKQQQLAQEKEFQLETLKLKREKAECTAIEIKARIAESTARAQHYQEQAHICELNRKVVLLRERHKLRQEGVPSNEIDMLLPISVTHFE